MKTLIWDLDGTLIDSYTIMTNNIYQVFRPYGQYNKTEIRKEITSTSITGFFIEEAAKVNVPLDRLFQHYHALTQEISPAAYPLMPHCKEVLESLANDGYKHYIYTHRGEDTKDILKAHHIDHLFEEIVTSANGFERKPSPQALDYLKEKYSLSNCCTYYVGDRILDVESGLAAGLKTIFVNAEQTYDEADYSISMLTELHELL